MTSLAELRQRGTTGKPAAPAPAAGIAQKIQLLEANANKLAKGASPLLNIEREIKAATHMLENNAELQATTPDSFLRAVSTAINTGLGLCNGHGFLGVDAGQAQFIPGWKGLIDLVQRTGRANAWTGVAYKGDVFDYGLGDSPFVHHKPEGDSDEWRDATHVYACGRISGQEYPVVAVWTVKKLHKHASQHGGAHYAHQSDTTMEGYARKIVLLQVLKYLPSSQELDNAIAADYQPEARTAPAAPPARDVTPPAPDEDHPAMRGPAESGTDVADSTPPADPAPPADEPPARRPGKVRTKIVME